MLLSFIDKTDISGSGVARGGRGDSCPRAPPGGGRQNPVKEFLKIYILRNLKKYKKHNENVVIMF